MDPALVNVVAAASKVDDSEASKTAGRLVERVLGPAADEIGAFLGGYTRFRLDNLQRMMELAEKKKAGRTGVISPRVAQRLVEEGSWTDDETMAEYLSGVLASSTSVDGRDDRAVPMSAMITSMSSGQLRAHFVIYRTLIEQLRNHPEVKPALDRRSLGMYAEWDEFATAIGKPGKATNSEMVHAISGLVRLGLLGDSWKIGTVEVSPEVQEFLRPRGWEGFVHVNPSYGGLELYTWALAQPDIHMDQVSDLAEAAFDPDLPEALTQVLYPALQ